MESYDESDATLFIGRTGVTRGHRQVLENYLKRYPNKAAMGTTTFSNIQVKLLSPEYAWVLGNWNLKRDSSAGGEAGGVFTLLLHKTAKGWRIIADHTS
jgi:ketosteroid isomerase-like protein